MRTKSKEQSAGIAKTLLLDPSSGYAVVAPIVAQRQDSIGAKRVRFSCGVTEDSAYAKHVLEEILPIVDGTCRALEIPLPSFDVGFPTLNAALVHGLEVNVSGRSCDTAVFLALLSAAVGIPIDEGIATTGQFLSRTGKIGMVEGLPAKAAAAAADPTTFHFVHPSLTRDRSLETLAPMERRRIEGALAQAASDVRITSVNDVRELIECVLKDEAVVLAGLNLGFFDGMLNAETVDAVSRSVAEHMLRGNDARLWGSVEERLGAGDNQHLHLLLREFVEYCLRHKIYPRSIGRTLRSALGGTPPATRRLRLRFPLIPMDAIVRLSQFAGEADYSDLLLLYEANCGKSLQCSLQRSVDSTHGKLNGRSAVSPFDTILYELSEANIARKFGIPIDEARSTFVPAPVLVDSWDEFFEVTTGLYCRFLYFTDISGPRFESQEAEGSTIVLLENAFAREGGIDEAYAEATQPSRKGGMRYVLDAMTERYKAEETEKHVLLTMKTGIDSGDYGAKVEFVAAFLERFASFLPEDAIAREPEDFASAWELLARAYASSLDEVRRLLRRL